MKKLVAIIVAAVAILTLSMSPAFAAQGVITEVNPSGVTQSDKGQGEENSAGGIERANEAVDHAANQRPSENTGSNDLK